MNETGGAEKCHPRASKALDVLEDDCGVCAEQGRLLDEVESVNVDVDCVDYFLC